MQRRRQKLSADLATGDEAKMHQRVLDITADITGKLTTVEEELARLGFKLKTNRDAQQRLRVLRQQVERANQAMLEVGIGIFA